MYALYKETVQNKNSMSSPDERIDTQRAQEKQKRSARRQERFLDARGIPMDVDLPGFPFSDDQSIRDLSQSILTRSQTAQRNTGAIRKQPRVPNPTAPAANQHVPLRNTVPPKTVRPMPDFSFPPPKISAPHSGS